MTQYSPSQTEPAASSQTQPRGRRWARAVTLLILVNLALVLFNLTYVPLRQIYIRYLPQVVQVYDPVKGIEPHPQTQRYLADINAVRSQIRDTGLDSPEVRASLERLRQQSTTLIEEDPFQAPGQPANFAVLKRRIKRVTGAESAQAAFDTFWRVDYLSRTTWVQSDAFLQNKLEPLLEQNYFRETLPTGQPFDDFWRIDIFFIIFFGGELLVRTFVISRYDKQINWLDALARRWYELPLVLPFWRWLRLLPALVRLHRSRLFNVENLLGQITHEPAAYLSDRVSKYIIVRLINQTQIFVREGAITDVWNRQSQYTVVGDPEKLDQITDRLVRLIVLRVMPTVKPDLEQLLRHSLQQALSGSQLYEGLVQIPGLDNLPEGALDGVADYLAQASCDVLANSYSDTEGRILLDNLSYDFRKALGRELQSKANSEDIKALVTDLLEEFKVNYIQKSHEYDPEETLQEVDMLHETTQSQTEASRSQG